MEFYQAMGGAATCRKLAEAFYGRVQRDPVLRPLFPGKTLRCAIEEFSAFLVQFLGGPAADTQHRWWLSLRESHLRFRIGKNERDAWMRNMAQALDEVALEEPARRALRDFFERSSAYVVNAGEEPVVAAEAKLSDEISGRWAAQRTLDKAVAAVRSGAAESAIGLAEECSRAVLAPLLGLMFRHGDAAMLDYVRQKLRGEPALAQERYSGRTLLHASAGAGDGATLEMLMGLGADPDVRDDGGHTPLYCVANECQSPGGPALVCALVRAGACVDACEGVKRCTALHMAARRGNVAIAAALLDCGAAIEARDSLGETPLRRAVNCNQVDVAALLLARGADRHSVGSKRLTPLLAARSAAMRRLIGAV